MPTTSTSITALLQGPAVQNLPDGTLDQHTWPLKIYTLGRFGLVRDGVPLHFTGKVPRKPLELLKTLVSCGGRGVSEHLLVDHLWPGAEVGAAIRAFSVALHRLRNVLGGNGFIQRQDKRITLNPDECWVDAWAFERLAKQAHNGMNGGESDTATALKMALQAIDNYTGHFLPTDLDQQWMTPMRERLRDKMRNLITMVGQHWEAAEDWHTALAIYQKGLETDDLHETFYQCQMICHSHLGNHGTVASVYQRCRITLALSGIKPSLRTTSVYEAATTSP